MTRSKAVGSNRRASLGQGHAGEAKCETFDAAEIYVMTQLGFSDQQIADLYGCTVALVKSIREGPERLPKPRATAPAQTSRVIAQTP